MYSLFWHLISKSNAIRLTKNGSVQTNATIYTYLYLISSLLENPDRKETITFFYRFICHVEIASTRLFLIQNKMYKKYQCRNYIFIIILKSRKKTFTFSYIDFAHFLSIGSRIQWPQRKYFVPIVFTWRQILSLWWRRSSNQDLGFGLFATLQRFARSWRKPPVFNLEQGFQRLGLWRPRWPHKAVGRTQRFKQ